MIADDEVIRRAIANGWTLEPLTLNSLGYMTGMWRRDGVGRPYGTFPGPRWETIDGKRVKTSDGPHTVTAADVFRVSLDHDDHCGECGRWIEYGGFVGFERERAPLPFCWDCAFWVDRIKRFNSRWFVTGTSTGPHFYSIGPAASPSRHNGFGGSWWTVTFHDGRVVETCDLWAGGDVPERFQDRLPVNAELSPGRRSTSGSTSDDR